MSHCPGRIGISQAGSNCAPADLRQKVQCDSSPQAETGCQSSKPDGTGRDVIGFHEHLTRKPSSLRRATSFLEQPESHCGVSTAGLRRPRCQNSICAIQTFSL